MGTSQLRNFVIPVAFLVIGLLVVFWPTLTSRMTMMQTDPGDTRFNNYILEHSYRWLRGDELHKNFWNPPFFWPKRNVAAYSDIHLGTAPLYWSIRLIGIKPDTSFQLWMILVFALNYFTMFILLQRGIGLTILGATGGAYVFAFAATRVAQLGHQAMLPQFFSVLAILFFLKSFGVFPDPGSRKRMATALCFGCIVAQAYTGFYLSWFLLFGLTVFLLFSVAYQESRAKFLKFLSTDPWFLLCCIACSFLLMGWMVYHYFLASLETGSFPWAEVSRMIPRISSWAYMGTSQLFYGWLYKYTSIPSLPMLDEHAMGLGLVTSVVGGYGLWTHKENRWIRILICSILCIGFLALMYPFGFSPWILIWKYFPGAVGIRAVSRVSLLLLVPFSIAVGLGLSSIKRPSIAILLLALICAEQARTTPYFNKLTSRAQVREIAEQIGQDCSAFYYVKVEVPGEQAEPIWKCQIDAMWAQMRVSKPTLNGYSGKFPPDWHLWHNIVTTREEFRNLGGNIQAWADSYGLDNNEQCLATRVTESAIQSKPSATTVLPLPESTLPVYLKSLRHNSEAHRRRGDTELPARSSPQ
jgi:hypothetical protein